MKHGFSLVELSIVLVILGLLTGGILAGQSLIRASELRAVSTEYGKYLIASHTFRDKYFALPGDFTKATDVWGTAPACPGTNAQPSTGAPTCNGDGDGQLNFSAVVGPYGNERFRIWHHLANAGMIEGTYTGVTGPSSATNHHVRGSNVPASKLGGACWSHFHSVGYSGDGNFFDIGVGSRLFIGAQGTGSCVNAFLKPEEAWNIDVKTDDGKPGQGNTLAYFWATCTNAGASNAFTADYALTTTTPTCSLHFKGFY